MAKEIIIVSGLPRSGTSLMMQILQAGGLPVICDNIRRADAANPAGYYEEARVNRLDKDNTWLKNNSGKAVKITSHWLRFIPEGQPAKIIFMLRDLDEIIISQNKMIKEKTDSTDTTKLKKAYSRHLQETVVWIKRQKYLTYHTVNYVELINTPQDEIKKINRFLDFKIGESAAGKVVRPQLYRSKIKKKETP